MFVLSSSVCWLLIVMFFLIMKYFLQLNKQLENDCEQLPFPHNRLCGFYVNIAHIGWLGRLLCTLYEVSILLMEINNHIEM